MSNSQQASGINKFEIEATIIRANGKKEKLGRIYSSNKLINYFLQWKIKLFNILH